MVEVWDPSARTWGKPTERPGDAYCYETGTSPATVRLTWQWSAGFTVFVR